MAARGGAGLQLQLDQNVGLGSSFQNNLMSWGVNLGYGLDGCARWRKVTITVAIK